MTNSIRALLTSAFVVLLAAPAAAVTINFSEFDHGEEITESQNVLIATENYGGGPDLGVAFDTGRSGTEDYDLQKNSAWSGGNLPTSTDFGNILIIQEDISNCDPNDEGVRVCDSPDDEGSRPAGRFEFDYSAIGSFTRFEMDLIDVEDVNPNALNTEPGHVEFWLNGFHLVGEDVAFTELLPPGEYGDHTANHFDVKDGTEFDQVFVYLGGSGGIDNIVAENMIPEPSAALLFFAGMTLVNTRLRRSK